jgi:hypothetical protein
VSAVNLIIDDNNWEEHKDYVPPGYSKGRVARNYAAKPLHEHECSDKLEQKRYPRDSWPDLISDMVRTKSTGEDIIRDAGMPPKDQNGTNFCWVNAVCAMFQAQLIYPYKSFSPASIGSFITNFHNEGGNGIDAIEKAAEIGFCPSEEWPDNEISRTYATEENRKLAANYKILKFLEVAANDFELFISALIDRRFMAIGLNWWGHEIGAIGARLLSKAHSANLPPVNILDMYGRVMYKVPQLIDVWG